MSIFAAQTAFADDNSSAATTTTAADTTGTAATGTSSETGTPGAPLQDGEHTAITADGTDAGNTTGTTSGDTTTTTTTVDQDAAKASYDKIVADIKSKYQTDYDTDQFFSENGVTATKDLSDANNPKATITFADGINHDGWETSIPFMRMADVDFSLFTFSNIGVTPYNSEPTFSTTDDYKKLANDWTWMFKYTGGNGKGRTVTEQDLINITSVTMDTDTSTWDFTKYDDYKPYADSSVPNADKFNADIYKIMRGNGVTITFRDGTSQHMPDSSFLIIDSLNLPGSSFYNRGKDKGSWAKDIVLNVGDKYSQDDYIYFVKDLYGNILDQQWEVAENQIYNAAISDFTLLDSKTLQPISTEKAGAGTYVVHYNKDTQHKWDWSPQTNKWIVKDTKLETAKDVTVNKGTAVTPTDFLTGEAFTNPAYATLEFETQPDVNTAGTTPVKIKITYGDGTTSEVTPNLTVNEYWLTPAEGVKVNQNSTVDWTSLVDQTKSALPSSADGTEPVVEVTNLDTTKLGAQTAHVKYTAGGNTVEADVPVTVVAVDFTVVPSYTTKQGTDIDAKTLVADEGSYTNFTITGYDKTMPGTQTVTVTGTDNAGNKLSKTVTVTVEANDFTLVDSKTVAQGTALTGADLVKDAGDYKDFTVSDYDATKPGTQTVKVTGTDNSGYKVTKTVTVTVEVKDFTLVDSKTVAQGTELTGADLVKDAGDYKDFTVSDYDATKPGTQTVKVTGTDNAGNKVSKTVSVTVVAKEFTLTPVTVKQGEELDLNKVVTSAGDYTDFTVEGFDNTKAGEQTVTVTGTDAAGNKLSKTFTVTVEEVQEEQPATTPDAGQGKVESGEDAKTEATDQNADVKETTPAATQATAAVKDAATKNSDQAKLPQTGNETTIAALALGGFVAMLGLGLASKKKQD